MAEVDHGSATTMEKKTVSSMSGAALGSAVAAAVSPTEALFRRRVEFHPARKVGVDFGGNDDFRIETLNPSNEDHMPVAGVGSGKRPAMGVVGEKGMMKRSDEHGLDLEIGFSITFRRIGAGLANLGNTCFLNSVLQCLTYTEPFAAYLQSGKHKSSCHIPGFCALCALQNHVMSALQSSGKILTPFHLVKNLRSISRNFRNARQEDAHEYMVNLLESIHKCCLPSGVQVESPSAFEKSLVYKIFGGRLRSQVKCTQCCYSSNKFDPFLDLSLEITKADSLCKALSHFTAVEQLDGGEKQYQCQHCKQKVRALKQLTLHKAPYVLAIHLKRFGSIISGQKIDKKVNFEPTLDLKPFISDQQEGNSVYTLYGVLVHAGWSTHSGHYYCYVRTSSGMWHSLNDNQVSQVSESVVLAQKAYILFYIRNRSSVPKRPVVAIGKENNFTNTSGNRYLDAFSQGLKEKIQTTSLDGRFYTSRQSLALGKIDDPHSNKTISTKDSSLNNFKMNQGSSLPLNGLGLPKAAPHAQSNGHVKKELDDSLGFPASQESSDSDVQMVAVGQQMGETSTESDSSSKENSCQMMVKNLVISLSNANKDNPIKKLSWSASSNDNATGKNVIMDVTQQNPFNGHPKHASGNIPKYEVDGVSRKAADELRPENIEAFKGVCAQQGSDILERFQRVHAGQNDGKIVEKKEFVDTFCQAASSKHDLHEELAGSQRVHTNGVNNEAIAMARKTVKHSHKINMYFGSRHLLFASLNLRKKRKLKRNRKKSLHKKDLTKLEEIRTFASGNRETSTSKMVNIISMEKKSTAKKQFHSHAKKEKHYNAENSSGNASRNRFAVMSSFNDNVMTLKGNPNHTNARNVDTHAKNSIKSTFMRGLGETFVPKWDDEEPPHPSTREMQNTQAKGIGYVLDEWDEGYDRGNRKKVRKSRQYVTGINPFEDVAMRNRQQKTKRLKFDQSSSANQPLRI